MIRYKSQFGFSLIELLVTISIFTIMMIVVLVNYRSFNKNSDFTNAVENAYFALREAQVYGVGSRTTAGGTTMCGSPASPFNCAYGVHFTTTITPGQYNFFIDTNGNRIMDTGESIGQPISLGSGTTITSLWCVRSGISGACENNYASVIFKRPNPDAFIAETPFPANSDYGVEVTISNGIKTARVVISEAGQISIQ